MAAFFSGVLACFAVFAIAGGIVLWVGYRESARLEREEQEREIEAAIQRVALALALSAKTGHEVRIASVDRFVKAATQLQTLPGRMN